jgi:hypothetical protein
MAFTENDLELGSVYWSLLVDFAKNRKGEVLTYGQLIKSAKDKYPDNAAVANAIAVSIGRKLEVVVWFCAENELPDLACLVVNQSGKPGKSYPNPSTWEDEKKKVANFDWENIQIKFETVIKQELAKTVKLKKRTEDEALNVRYEHWRKNRPRYPANSSEEQKLDMLQLLMEGHDLEYAFQQAYANHLMMIVEA